MRKGPPQAVLDLVWGAARGSYQEGLLYGRESWSGSSLRGKANSQWGASYARSRKVFLERANAALAGSKDGARWRVGTALVACSPGGRPARELLLWPRTLGDDAFCWSTGARVLAPRPASARWVKEL